MRDDFRRQYMNEVRHEGRFTVPTIEYNGEIGETKVDSLNHPHERITHRRGPARWRGNDTEVYVDRDIFVPHTHGYKPPNGSQRVMVTVFVHDAFYKGIASTERNKIIKSYIKKYAPWFFSYGERQVFVPHFQEPLAPMETEPQLSKRKNRKAPKGW